MIISILYLIPAQGLSLAGALQKKQLWQMSPAEVKKEIMQNTGIYAFADEKNELYYVATGDILLLNELILKESLWCWQGKLKESDWQAIWYDDAPVPENAELALQWVDGYNHWEGAVYSKIQRTLKDNICAYYPQSFGKNSEPRLHIIAKADGLPKKNYDGRDIAPIWNQRRIQLTQAILSGKIWKMRELEVRSFPRKGTWLIDSQAKVKDRSNISALSVKESIFHWKRDKGEAQLESIEMRMANATGSEYTKAVKDHVNLLGKILGVKGRMSSSKTLTTTSETIWTFEGENFMIELVSRESWREGENRSDFRGAMTLYIMPPGKSMIQGNSIPNADAATQKELSPFVRALTSGELWKQNAEELRGSLMKGWKVSPKAEKENAMRLLNIGALTLDSGAEETATDIAEARLSEVWLGWKGTQGTPEDWQNFWNKTEKNDCGSMRVMWISGNLHTANNQREQVFKNIEKNRLTLLNRIFGPASKCDSKNLPDGKMTSWRWECEHCTAELRTELHYPAGTKPAAKDKIVSLGRIDLILAGDVTGITSYDEQKTDLNRTYYKTNESLYALLKSGKLWEMTAAEVKDNLMNDKKVFASAQKGRDDVRTLNCDSYQLESDDRKVSFQLYHVTWCWQGDKGSLKDWLIFWKTGDNDASPTARVKWIQAIPTKSGIGSIEEVYAILARLKQLLGDKPKEITKDRPGTELVTWRWKAKHYVIELRWEKYYTVDHKVEIEKKKMIKLKKIHKQSLELIIAPDIAGLNNHDR